MGARAQPRELGGLDDGEGGCTGRCQQGSGVFRYAESLEWASSTVPPSVVVVASRAWYRTPCSATVEKLVSRICCLHQQTAIRQRVQRTAFRPPAPPAPFDLAHRMGPAIAPGRLQAANR